MRAVTLTLAVLTAGCGHGGRTKDPGGRGRPDAGVSNVVPADAAPLDAAPAEFPEMFSRSKEHPACDPRKPDRKNPNCCRGWRHCQGLDFCFVEISYSDGSVVQIPHGWNDGVIRGQHALLVDANGKILDSMAVFKVYAGHALFSSDLNEIPSGLSVRMLWSCAKNYR